MCARRKQSVIFKIDRTMNYFLLAETDFFRLINEAGDCNMETAYTAFATQVIELCNGGMDMNLTVIALAYIEIELQHHPVRNLSEEKREIAAYVSKALSFVRKMQKFLATPQVPPLISANNATETTASLLQWTGNAIDLVELIYGIDVMGCINNGNMPLKQLAPLLYKIFGVDSILLGTLAYNVGPAKLLGSKTIPKSTLIKKLEAGDRNIYREYIAFCNYKGKRHAMLLKRRKAEFALLYIP